MDNHQSRARRTRFDPVADFLDSKRHTLKQLAQRIRELDLGDDDKALLSRLTSEQRQELREDAHNCLDALESLEAQFAEACEEAEETDADGEDDSEDEDDIRSASRVETTRLDASETTRAWPLVDSHGPTLAPSGKDFEASRRAKRLISAVPTACWFNARRLIEVVDEFADAALIEGYVVSVEEGTYFEHGWVVHRGMIIDPTLPDEDYEYFAGLEFIGRDSIATFDRVSLHDCRRTRDDPFFHAFGWGGVESPHMTKARRAADARVQRS